MCSRASEARVSSLERGFQFLNASISSVSGMWLTVAFSYAASTAASASSADLPKSCPSTCTVALRETCSSSDIIETSVGFMYLLSVA